MPYSKEQLTPRALKLFAQVREQLPPEIGERLASNAKFTTHGTRKTVYNFDIWDNSQNGVLPRSHFKYCLAYDFERLCHPPYDGYLHLWLNTVRIYRDRTGIKTYLENEIPKVVPRGFKLKFVEKRAIDCGFTFQWPRNLDEISERLLDRYVSLISAIHPVIMPVIDRFADKSFCSSERKAEVSRRGRIKFERAGPLDSSKIRKYSRSIPPSWKSIILERTSYKCANPTCGCDLRVEKFHIDHIVPFSRGGDTVLENLQALCWRCNLAKGNQIPEQEISSNHDTSSATSEAIQTTNESMPSDRGVRTRSKRKKKPTLLSRIITFFRRKK